VWQVLRGAKGGGIYIKVGKAKGQAVCAKEISKKVGSKEKSIKGSPISIQWARAG